jgi:TonB family protein
MKNLIICLISILVSSNLYAQTHEGVDLTNFNKQDGFKQLKPGQNIRDHLANFIKLGELKHPEQCEKIYYKYEAGRYGEVCIIQDSMIAFLSGEEMNYRNYYVLVWPAMYNDIVKIYGKEQYNNDSIPESVQKSKYYDDTLEEYILIGKAKLCRWWRNKKVKLLYDNSGVSFIVYKHSQNEKNKDTIGLTLLGRWDMVKNEVKNVKINNNQRIEFNKEGFCIVSLDNIYGRRTEKESRWYVTMDNLIKIIPPAYDKNGLIMYFKIGENTLTLVKIEDEGIIESSKANEIELVYKKKLEKNDYKDVFKRVSNYSESSTKKDESKVDDGIYFVAAETMPEPIGGLKTIQSDIDGKVYVLAFINEEGNVAKAEILKGITKTHDDIALKTILDTKFRPGKQMEKPVKVQISIPVYFKLEK